MYRNASLFLARSLQQQTWTTIIVIIIIIDKDDGSMCVRQFANRPHRKQKSTRQPGSLGEKPPVDV